MWAVVATLVMVLAPLGASAFGTRTAGRGGARPTHNGVFGKPDFVFGWFDDCLTKRVVGVHWWWKIRNTEYLIE